jgi:hypothetical protein
MRNGSIRNTSGSSLTVGPFFCKNKQIQQVISEKKKADSASDLRKKKADSASNRH